MGVADAIDDLLRAAVRSSHATHCIALSGEPWPEAFTLPGNPANDVVPAMPETVEKWTQFGSAVELRKRYAGGKREFRDANLRGVELRGADLRGAIFSRADFSGADLCRADLSITNLHGANLCGANLCGADLGGADLVNATLSRANLSNANLHGANLNRANLCDANLSRANFCGADLCGADLCGAEIWGTFLTDLDISPLCDAEPPVKHLGPSIVDFRAILRTLRSPKLKEFLQRSGMPEVFVEYDVSCALSLETKVLAMLQSTFISYGSPDEPFARRLYEALHRNGVTTFFFAEHAELGKPLHRVMRDGVNQHDRVILICSKASLDRNGVLNEIEETLRREAAGKGEALLIPIQLDDYIFSGWNPPDPGTAQTVRARVIGDFTGADVDPGKFNEGLRRLIAALKK